jgi:hypothetical protein
MEKLFAVDSFRNQFAHEIEKLSEEMTYRSEIKELLDEYYLTLDDRGVKDFLQKVIKEKKWEPFNHIFIRKAIDMAIDRNSNEREYCSKLLKQCTQDYNFSNRDFGYAFDHFIWVREFFNKLL